MGINIPAQRKATRGAQTGRRPTRSERRTDGTMADEKREARGAQMGRWSTRSERRKATGEARGDRGGERRADERGGERK